METIWQDVKAALRKVVPEHSFRMWIEPIRAIQGQQGSLILNCPNCFSRKRVQELWGTLIESEIRHLTGLGCHFTVDGQAMAAAKPACAEVRQLALPEFAVRPQMGRLLRKDFTFDQFVVGTNNDFAYTAALSLACHTHRHQNCLMLLSKTGMGKSHLAQAAGHHILSQLPGHNVFYLTADDFANEMVHAFRHDEAEAFKTKYRKNCDVLLLEDVHHLSGKERTQTELSLALDMLFEANKKVIFSSSCLPADIPKLNDKLRSRLCYGLISNIEPPDFRTRVRIVEKKAALRGYQLPKPVIEYLASELTQDVRQLESGMIGVTAKSSLLGVPIDLPLAESVVKNIVHQSRRITIDAIKALVSKEFKISIEDLVSSSRKQRCVRPRQIAIYLSRKYTDTPLQTIGKSFNRYHATAMYSIATIEKEMKKNPAAQRQVAYLCQKLEQGRF